VILRLAIFCHLELVKLKLKKTQTLLVNHESRNVTEASSDMRYGTLKLGGPVLT